jgi:hypothetical protein
VRLDNSASENVSIMLSQTDDSGTHYPYVTSSTAYNDRWTKLQGSFTLDVNGVLDQLSIYISGPVPDVNFYMDDAEVVAEPVNCSEVQQAGFNLAGDISGDCQVNLLDVEMLSRNWLNTDCNISSDCLDADIEFDGWIDLFDFASLASDWLNCNNPQDANCLQNW